MKSDWRTIVQTITAVRLQKGGGGGQEKKKNKISGFFRIFFGKIIKKVSGV